MDNFSNKFINNWKELNHGKVGIECEFFSNHSLIKTVELLNLEFAPIDIHFQSVYHPDFTPTEKKWTITPDHSGGSDMVELITGPLNYVDARLILAKILNFIKNNGYTDDHCSIHINVSFDDLQVKELNPVKLILNFNEDFVYSKFPNRRNNIYAKSIKYILPFEDFEDSETGLNNIIQCLQIPDDTKYYGINLQKRFKNYLEFRYIGGENYENKTDDVLELMDYFIIQLRLALQNELNDEDNLKLLSYLEDNINWFKQYKTYKEFLYNIDNIRVQIDKDQNIELITANWDKIKPKLFQLIKSTVNIKNALINYNSTNNVLEVIGANLQNISYVKGIDFIECNIQECTLYNCNIVDCNIENGYIYNSNIYESKLQNCKLQNCNALEFTELINCMFDGGKLDCIMKEGVFRSGSIGENADIEYTVKMNSKDSFWSLDPINKKIDKLKKQ